MTVWRTVGVKKCLVLLAVAGAEMVTRRAATAVGDRCYGW